MGRPRDDRVIAGVAAGIANHFGVDPVWVRVLFVIAGFMAFVGVIAYVVLAIALPEVDHAPPSDQPSPGSPTVFWVAASVILFVAGTSVWMPVVASVWPRSGLLIPVVIVAVGVALWQRPGGSPGAPTNQAAAPQASPDAGPAGTYMAAAPGVAVGVGATDSVTIAGASGTGPAATGGTAVTPNATVSGAQSSTGATMVAGSPTPARAPVPVPPAIDREPVWWSPPKQRPRPSYLGPLTLGIAVLVAVVQSALDGLDLINVSPTQVLATALIILGTGMVVGTMWGRAKWLSGPAVVVAAMLVVVQTSADLGIDFSGSVMSGFYDVDDLARLGGGGVGDVVVDLTEDTPSRLAHDQGAGGLTVIVPWDADVDLSATVGAGRVHAMEIDGAYFVSEESGDATDSWPSEWDPDDVDLRDFEFWLNSGKPIDMEFSVHSEVSDEAIGFGYASWNNRTFARGLNLSVDRELTSPWINDGPPLELELGMGAGSILITRGAPPEDVIQAVLEEQ